MIRTRAALAALLVAVTACGAKPAAPAVPTAPSLDRRPVSDGPLAAAIDQVVQRYHAAGTFDGVVVVRSHGTLIYRGAVGDVTPGTVFPLASVMKQVVALLVFQEIHAGHLALDMTVGSLLGEQLPPETSIITIEDLLQHTSGLPDPDATPLDGAVPSFYTRPAVGTALAEAQRCSHLPAPPPPPATGAPLVRPPFHYNNCDYLVLGAILEQVTGSTIAALVRDRIMAKIELPTWDPTGTAPATLGRDADDHPAPANFHLATLGAAGALVGDATDLARWSQALLDHELLDEATTSQMFTSTAALQYEAYGSWVYPAPLKARKPPLLLVERQGRAAGVRILAVFSPTDQFTVSIIAPTERADLFNLWTRQGLPFELIELLGAQSSSSSSPSAAAGAR